MCAKFIESVFSDCNHLKLYVYTDYVCNIYCKGGDMLLLLLPSIK